MSAGERFRRSIPDSSLLMLRRFSTIPFRRSTAVSVSERRDERAPGPLPVTGSMSAVIEPLMVVRGVRSSWDTLLRSTRPSRLRLPCHQVPAVLLSQPLPLDGQGNRAAQHLE